MGKTPPAGRQHDVAAPVISDHDTITVHVPLAFAKRGGRKQIVLPDGTSSWAPPCARVDNTMVKAIARAFRWREMLENGTHATIAEIAAAEKINESYVGRIMRLTLLAPDIVEAILSGRQPAELQLEHLLSGVSPEWPLQRLNFQSAGKLAGQPVYGD
jgi:hypothetical protein